MDFRFTSNLDFLAKLIQNKFDGVGIVDGMEGSGKSELAKQMCLYHDPNFSAKDVFYSYDQFKTWLKTAKKGQAGLWDEFVMAGMSNEATSKIQKLLIKNLTMIRKKGLMIVLVIPYFFMLNKYFAKARSRYLITCYSKGLKRGYARLYDYETKKLMYTAGLKNWNYNLKKYPPQLVFRFDSWTDELVDEEEIQRKKDEAIEMLDAEKNELILTPKEIEAIAGEYGIPYCSQRDKNLYTSFLKLRKKCRKHLKILQEIKKKEMSVEMDLLQES